MANTHGFEVIAELTVNALKQLLKAAWKSGGDNSAEGVIPEYINIPGPRVPAPVSFGPYNVASGHIQIPQEQLDLAMNTGLNGVNIKLGTIIQVEIANPPIDSAKYFDMTADIFVQTPIRVIDDNFELGADFNAMPANGVTVNITSGDPVGPVTNAAIEEFVHKKYQDGSIPHVIDNYPITFYPFSMKARIEFYDDLSDPLKKIVISNQDATHVKISIPTYIRFYEITGSMLGYSLENPMGIKATTVMVAEYTSSPGMVTANLPAATVELTNLVPADGVEGTNYSINKSRAFSAGQDLDIIIKTGFNTAAADQLRGHVPIQVEVPTMDQIQDFISEKVKAELLYRSKIQIWKVVDPSGTTPIQEVRPRALADSFAICINPGPGADENAVTNFIPASRDFAIATSKGKVQAEFNKKRDEQYGALPTTLADKVEGKTVELNSLNLELEPGHLNVYGGVTVVDLIADSIDVDADFSQKVTLRWEDQADGTQMLKHDLDGDPDVSMSTWAKVLLVFIGLFTLGIVGVIIAAIILVVVEGIAENIGGFIARDESGKVTGIGAWPENLDNIGNVKARFENPVNIESDGLVFGGNMIITSTYSLTSVDMARSHGPYFTSGNIPVHLNGGLDKPDSLPSWETGDGKSFNVRNTSYRYGKSGLYIAKVHIRVAEEGGATTRHFAGVKVQNVPPKVHFNDSGLTINEGQEIEIKGSFTDDNWLDTHKVWIDFGDNTKTQKATLFESNNEPQAIGNFSIKHAWCDNGTFQVRVKVEDSAGGIGESAMSVKVLNVAPTVYTLKSMCVLKDQNVRLEAVFTDPGWCDSHVGTWECGDGTIRMATIKEKHMSPQGVGVASVSHVYKCPGTYFAKVVVIDDDGGKGVAFLLVKVTELMNASFENGFRFRNNSDDRSQQDSMVGNEWLTFAEPIFITDGGNKLAQPLKVVHFIADEYVCRDGQRAQGLKLEGSGLAGVRQSICANIGWDYEFTAYYHLPVTAEGTAVIGIDPTGGTKATSDKIIWVRSLPVNEWVHISVRATAQERMITCFIGVQQDNGQSGMYIDKASLFMIQPCDPLLLIKKPEAQDQDEIEKYEEKWRYNFHEAEKFISDNVDEITTPTGTYHPSSGGVRFVDVENPAPRFRFDKQTSEKAMEIIVKGAIHMARNLGKQAVESALLKARKLFEGETKSRDIKSYR